MSSRISSRISGRITGRMITCSMCGQRFDPAGQAACQGCPLQKGCQLVCCPVCGFENVDPERSILARLARRWFGSDLEENQRESVGFTGGADRR